MNKIVRVESPFFPSVEQKRDPAVSSITKLFVCCQEEKQA
jgi:hypothetical protein